VIAVSTGSSRSTQAASVIQAFLEYRSSCAFVEQELRPNSEQRRFHAERDARFVIARFGRASIARMKTEIAARDQAAFLHHLMTNRKRHFAATLIQKHWRRMQYGRPAEAKWRALVATKQQERACALRAAAHQARVSTAARLITKTARIYLARRQLKYRRATLLERKIDYLRQKMTAHCIRVVKRFCYRVLRRVIRPRMKAVVAFHLSRIRQWDAEQRFKQMELEAKAGYARSLHVRLQKVGRGWMSRMALKRRRVLQVRAWEIFNVQVVQRVGRGLLARLMMRARRSSAPTS
jgi:hypothetical protein